ncbi:MAG: aromatic amino acid lyase [Actinomycetota bacterium]|nr:aromatic amino acid lyase [Actinomycetota bacterium]
MNGDALERIAWHSEELILDEGLLRRVDEARATMLAILATGERVYAVTTGTGFMARQDLTATEQASQQRNLLMGRAVGSAPYLSAPETRALLAARLVNLISGYAGVTAKLCEYIVARLNDGFTPAVPRRTMGTSGEVIALAHAFQTFIGVGLVLEGDTPTPAAAALAARGAEPYVLQSKEGIALLAGAPGSVAVAFGRCRRAAQLSRELLVTAACVIDALQAPLDPYSAEVGRLGNDPLLLQGLESLESLLEGSERGGRQIQAPVSLRVIPQVVAHLDRTVARLSEDTERALAAVTDSPAFVNGRFVTNGGFHQIGLAASMDGLALALAQGAELAAQWCHRLLDHRFSGLPDQLTTTAGPQCGPMVVYKRALGAVNELRRLSVPASLGLSDSSLGQEDAMTFAFEAAEKLRRVEELVREVLACTLLVARQAWALRGLPPPRGLARTVALVTAAVEPITVDRPLGAEIERLIEVLEGLGGEYFSGDREAESRSPAAGPSAR